MSWLRNIFWRRQAPPPLRILDVGPDSPDTWVAGEWAVCAYDEGGWIQGSGEPSINPPAKNEINHVLEVYLLDGVQFLVFGNRPDQGWIARCFRKVKPDAREGEREDWALLLDSMKRRVDA